MKRILKKLKDLPQGVKASFAFFISSVVTTGISFISTPLFTRLLSSEEYGKISVFLTWLQIFGIIAMFCLSYGVFNNGMLDHKENRDQYSFSMLILSNVITAVFSIILLVLYPVIYKALQIDITLIILMIAIFLTQPAYNFWVSRQRFEYKYKATVFFSILTAFLSTLIAVVCILFTKGDKFYARIFGAEITLILFYLMFYVYLAKKSHFKVNTSYWKTAFLFNLPLIPHYLSAYLLSSSNKLMISYLINDSATAFYSVAYSVAAVVSIVWSAANASLIPFTYEKCKQGNYKAISNVTMPILVFFAVVCLIIILLAPEVVAIMATSEYREAIYVIPPIVGGIFFQVQYFLYANVLYYYKKPRYVMYASITAAVLNVIFNYIFIPMFGYIASGYVTLICYFIQATIDYIAMKRVVKNSIYNMKFVGTLSTALIIISIISNLTYNNFIIRYCVILFILVFAIVYRKKILSIFLLLKKVDTSDEA